MAKGNSSAYHGVVTNAEESHHLWRVLGTEEELTHE